MEVENSLMPEGEQSVFRMKLQKNHPNRKDLEAISSLLHKYCLLVPESMAESGLIINYDGVMSVDGYTYAFTSSDLFDEQMQILTERQKTGMGFIVRYMLFDEIAGITDRHNLQLFIDVKLQGNERFLVYKDGNLVEAVLDGV